MRAEAGIPGVGTPFSRPAYLRDPADSLSLRGAAETAIVTESLAVSAVPTTTSTRPLGVSLVIPAYNEEDRIVRSLDGYLPVLESSFRPYEVIVVADGSDRTADIARGYESRGVRVLQGDERMGKGGAILEGLRASRFDVVGFTDADGSLSPADFSKLVDLVWRSSFDCVIASRWVKGSRWIRKEPLVKRVASRGFNLLVRALLRLPVRDSQCGAKFFRGRLVDRLLRHVAVTNFTTDVGFLFHAQRCGARITEVGITWDHDPRTHFKLGAMIPVMFLSLMGIRIMNLPLGRFIPPRFVKSLSTKLGVY